jgi:flagellar basal-body rod protein FlgB
MASFLRDVTDRGASPALVHTLAFAHARAKMIAENVANVHTPGFRTRTLDVGAFQQALRGALQTRGSDGSKPLDVKAGSEVQTRPDGSLRVRPSLTPVQNVLWHDGTNQSIERQMSDLAQTGLTYDVAAALLRNRVDRMRTAIRGTVA